MTVKIVFITGASSGIGRALAEQFHLAGFRLALVARRAADIESWARSKNIRAEQFRVYGADVSDADSIITAARACIEELGVPDVVIANAGISVGMDTAEREDLDVLSRVLATNVVGMACTFHAFIHAMSRRGSGTLVGIASVAGVRGLPGHGAYCASKAAVITYCESLRGELRSAGIGVVTICPGYIDTPLTRANRYSMPFLMSAEKFAQAAYKAIEIQTSYRVIPWQMAAVAKLLRVLPNWLYDKLLAGRPRKQRQTAV